MGIQRFEDLEIWQEARELCKIIRVLTLDGGFARDYKFRDQIRDSCGETRSQSYRAFDYEWAGRSARTYSG